MAQFTAFLLEHASIVLGPMADNSRILQRFFRASLSAWPHLSSARPASSLVWRSHSPASPAAAHRNLLCRYTWIATCKRSHRLSHACGTTPSSQRPDWRSFRVPPLGRLVSQTDCRAMNDLFFAETASLHPLFPKVENRLTSNRGHFSVADQ